MSDDIREALSALLDGELPKEEVDHLLDRISGDESIRGAWAGYHLGGDLMRGERLLVGATSIADRVREQLRDEPPLPVGHREAANDGYGWGRIAVGAALAASVAALAVFVAPMMVTSPVPDAGPQVAAMQPPPPMLDRSAVVRVDTGAEGTRWKNLRAPGVESRLNGYLVDHSGYAPMGGVLPYTTFVSYDQSR